MYSIVVLFPQLEQMIPIEILLHFLHILLLMFV